MPQGPAVPSGPFGRALGQNLLRRIEEELSRKEDGLNIVNLIISLLGGAAGGNVAGNLMKDKSLGTLGDSIVGILGGGIGGAILQTLGLGAAAAGGGGSLDIGSILANVAGGGVGGGILMAVIGAIRSTMAKSA